MSEPYDLRSNIKGKPGSQGTLFQVKDKGLLNSALRWPRGYTPERQAEVRDVLSKTPVDAPPGVNPHENRARVEDVIARSTIPVRKDVRHADAHMGLQQIHGAMAPGTEGTYWPHQRRVAIDLRHPEGERNLVHELGHHADNIHGETNSRAIAHMQKTDDWTGNTISGMGEAVADNYMEEHYRTRGRSPQAVSGGRYEENYTPSVLARKVPGYTSIRPAVRFSDKMGPQFKQGELF
jgi:hypothetical protein